MSSTGNNFSPRSARAQRRRSCDETTDWEEIDRAIENDARKEEKKEKGLTNDAVFLFVLFWTSLKVYFQNVGCDQLAALFLAIINHIEQEYVGNGGNLNALKRIVSYVPFMVIKGGFLVLCENMAKTRDVDGMPSNFIAREMMIPILKRCLVLIPPAEIKRFIKSAKPPAPERRRSKVPKGWKLGKRQLPRSHAACLACTRDWNSTKGSSSTAGNKRKSIVKGGSPTKKSKSA